MTAEISLADIWKAALTVVVTLIGTLLGLVYRNLNREVEGNKTLIGQMNSELTALKGEHTEHVSGADARWNEQTRTNTRVEHQLGEFSELDERLSKLEPVILGTNGEGGLIRDIQALRKRWHDLTSDVIQTLTGKVFLLEEKVKQLQKEKSS